MDENYTIIILLAILLIALFLVPRFRLKNNVNAIIKIFREHNATGEANAKTLDELGLRFPRSTFSILQSRDTIFDAFQLLKNEGIIKELAGGKLYLSEENLQNSRWK